MAPPGLLGIFTMSDKDRGDFGDRGTYSPPTEDNLSYESHRTPVSRDKAPITLIISGICLVVLLLVVVILYNSGTLNKHGRIAPEVGDTLGDIKEGQVQDAKPLSDQDLNDSGVATFAPGSEVPGARPAASVTKTTHVSESTMQKVDQEIRAIIDQQYNVARAIIEGNRDKMEAMAGALLEWETIDADQIEDIMQGRAPRPPKNFDSSSSDTPNSKPPTGVSPVGDGGSAAAKPV